MNPPRLVRRHTAAWNDTVDMGMKQQVLAPGVKNAEEADLGPQVLRVPRHRPKCFSDDTEQEVVELGLILQDERVQFVWQREHDVEITRFEKLLFPRLDPPLTSLSLTLVAMPVTAAVV